MDKPIVQVAARPLGLNAIELVWEINDVRPDDSRHSRTHTAAFVSYGQEKLLRNKRFEIHASLDQENFVKIAEIAGPANTYVHESVTTGWLHYYKIRAMGSDGTLIAESPIVTAAAGKNLIRNAGFEQDAVGPVDPDQKLENGELAYNPPHAFAIAEGARPYLDEKRILTFSPEGTGVGQVSCYGNIIPITQGELFLQGGWVRAPGNVWFGRFFFDEQQRRPCWGYLMVVRDTPEWTFCVQLLEPDPEGKAYQVEDGATTGMPSPPWKYPRDAYYLCNFVTAFGPGEVDDHWILRVKKAPLGACLEVPAAE